MMIRGSLVLCLMLVACNSYQLPKYHTGYSSGNNNIALDSLTLHKDGPDLVGITYNLTYLNRGHRHMRDPELSNLWLIDDQPITAIFSSKPDDFRVSTFTYWGASVYRTFLLRCDQNIDILKDRVIKHVVELLMVDDLYTDTLDVYTTVKYEVVLSGNDIIRAINDGTRMKNVKFNHLQYEVDSGLSNDVITGTFSFPANTPSKVKKISALFDGIQTTDRIQEDKFVQFASSCDQNGCKNSNDYMTMSIDTKNSILKTQLVMSDSIVKSVPGVLVISAETSNVLNSKVTVSFDVTYEVFEGGYSGKKFLTEAPVITDLLLARENNDDITLSCSALGVYMYLRFEMVHVLSDGQVRQVDSTYRAVNLFKTTEYFKLPDDVVKSGTYECRVTNTDNAKRVEKTIFVK